MMHEHASDVQYNCVKMAYLNVQRDIIVLVYYIIGKWREFINESITSEYYERTRTCVCVWMYVSSRAN